MIRGLCAIFSIFLITALLMGCSAVSVSDETEAYSTESIDPTDSAYEMIERSLLNHGNNYRLKKVLDKILLGENVTVGFIGGSITEGFNAASGNNYAVQVTHYLDNAYSNGTGKVKCVNAGLSGTPSMLGLIRADDDLLYAQPDLIFIEFAVNDAQSFTDKQAFEALIRKCLNQDNDPAVILLYSVTDNGYTCQNDMALTGYYYDLPSISVRDAIMPEIESGNMRWSDWSDDEVHPHDEGHMLYSKFIINLIETLAEQELDSEYSVPEETKFKRDWSGMKLYDRDNLKVLNTGSFSASSSHPHFSGGFSHAAGAGNEGLTFEVSGSTVFLVYKMTKSTAYGTAEVLVDGEAALHLSGYSPDGWNNPVTKLVFSEKQSAVHQITIRMQEGDEDKAFELLCVGVSD